jgi:hypothetical protein
MASMSHLAHQGDRFQRAKAFLDARPFPLANTAAGMSCRPPVDQAVGTPTIMLRDVRVNYV